MIKLNFILDKNLAFIYFIHALVAWSPYQSTNERKRFKEVVSPLSKEENEVLGKFEQALKKPGNGYRLAWQMYAKKTNDTESTSIVEIISIFKKKFNVFWEQELKPMRLWRDFLESYDWGAHSLLLNKVRHFFNVGRGAFPREINIYIVPGAGERFVSAHTHQTQPDMIVLNISQFSKEKYKDVISTVLHEIIHQIEYKSTLSRKLYKKARIRYITPLIATSNWNKATLPNWSHLFRETIITSIAGQGDNSYFFLDHSSVGAVESSHIKTIGICLRKRQYNQFIRQTARFIVGKTKYYLDHKKVIDLDFVKEISKIWLKTLKTPEIKVKKTSYTFARIAGFFISLLVKS